MNIVIVFCLVFIVCALSVSEVLCGVKVEDELFGVIALFIILAIGAAVTMYQ